MEDSFSCQIELYHSMIDEEGTVGEVDAMKAYRALLRMRMIMLLNMMRFHLHS